MFGRKVRIPPTPEMIPSTTREIIMSPTCREVSPLVTAAEKDSRKISKYPLSQSPTVKVSRKTSAIIPRKSGSPQILCVRKWSNFSVKASFSDLLTSIS